MRTLILLASVFVMNLAIARGANTVQGELGGAAVYRIITSATNIWLCLRPFKGNDTDAEKQEMLNSDESASVRLTPNEVKQITAALADAKNYNFEVSIDCWYYNYARLKFGEGYVIDFSPNNGLICVKRYGKPVGGVVFVKGYPVLDSLLRRYFPNDEVINRLLPKK